MQDLRSFLNVKETLAGFLQEDIGTGDITGESTIEKDRRARAEVLCKSRGLSIVSGLEEASIIFNLCGCHAETLVGDGSKVTKGKVVMKVSGSARDILKAERTALNMIMRMSGIATETQSLVRIAGKVGILATRKTAPGLRYFDKKAVLAGGGGAHRMRLHDMVLIKDNHLAIAGSPKDCIKKVRDHVGNSIKIECEVKSTIEAIDAASAGADIVMLDNFTPAQAKKTIATLLRMGLLKGRKIEISGGVNKKNIQKYIRSRPDFISLGYITHSARAVDFSLEIIPG